MSAECRRADLTHVAFRAPTAAAPAMRDRRKPVGAARLAGILEVSERTIYRDVADLIAQGAHRG
jgi:hypothetical protein